MSAVLLVAAGDAMEQRRSSLQRRMSAFDPKRTLATRFCCVAQPLPLAEEIAGGLPVAIAADAAMNSRNSETRWSFMLPNA